MEDLERRLKALERQLEQKQEELKAAHEEREVLNGLVTANQMALKRLEQDRQSTTPTPPGSGGRREQQPLPLVDIGAEAFSSTTTTTTTSSSSSSSASGDGAWATTTGAGESISGPAAGSEQTAEAMARLEANLKLERFRLEASTMEKKQLEQALKAKDKDLEKALKDLEEVKTETGWSRSNANRAPFKESKVNSDDRIADLQRQLHRYQEEERATRALERKRSQQIEGLAKDIEIKTRLGEELNQANNMLKVKEREIKDLTEELKVMKRIQSKKDKIILDIETTKDSPPLRALEGDKKALQAEVSKQIELRRQQERTIRSQLCRIDMLEARLSAVTSALRDLGLERRVADVVRDKGKPTLDEENKDLGSQEVFEVLSRDIDHLRHALALREVLIQERDQTIEALDKKVEIVQHAKRVESRTTTAERKELFTQMEELKRAMEAQSVKHLRELEGQRSEVIRLRKRIRELTRE